MSAPEEKKKTNRILDSDKGLGKKSRIIFETFAEFQFHLPWRHSRCSLPPRTNDMEIDVHYVV